MSLQKVQTIFHRVNDKASGNSHTIECCITGLIILCTMMKSYYPDPCH